MANEKRKEFLPLPGLKTQTIGGAFLV